MITNNIFLTKKRKKILKRGIVKKSIKKEKKDDEEKKSVSDFNNVLSMVINKKPYDDTNIVKNDILSLAIKNDNVYDNYHGNGRNRKRKVKTSSNKISNNPLQHVNSIPSDKVSLYHYDESSIVYTFFTKYKQLAINDDYFPKNIEDIINNAHMLSLDPNLKNNIMFRHNDIINYINFFMRGGTQLVNSDVSSNGYIYTAINFKHSILHEIMHFNSIETETGYWSYIPPTVRYYGNVIKSIVTSVPIKGVSLPSLLYLNLDVRGKKIPLIKIAVYHHLSLVAGYSKCKEIIGVDADLIHYMSVPLHENLLEFHWVFQRVKNIYKNCLESRESYFLNAFNVVFGDNGEHLFKLTIKQYLNDNIVSFYDKYNVYFIGLFLVTAGIIYLKGVNILSLLNTVKDILEKNAMVVRFIVSYVGFIKNDETFKDWLIHMNNTYSKDLLEKFINKIGINNVGSDWIKNVLLNNN